MSKTTNFSKKDYLNLIKEIKEHDRRYYEENAPVISDYEYDQLVKQAEEIEKKHPDWIPEEGTPTKKIGEKPVRGFKTVKHDVPMLSLANSYSQKEVAEFVDRVQRLLDQSSTTFCCELKIDGCAISIRYEKGRLVRGVTRGDGKKGDDVTQNIFTIESLPKQLKGQKIPNELEIRGEVYMNRSDFLAANQEKEEEGKEPWANPRNAAAGSLKLLDSQEAAKRKLQIICYSVAQGLPSFITSQFEMHHFLGDLGIPIGKKEYIAQASTVEEIFAYADKIEKARASIPFDIDGIVIKVDNLHDHEFLGTTGKSPRGSIAYKFAPEQAKTKILDITVQVGRTGVLTPVAELEPVFLAGSHISRATLHNEDEIRRKDIRIGDTVVIEKGGDVIPKVVSVDHSKRPKDAKSWHMPEHCPFCRSKVVHKPGEVAVRCPNKTCQEQGMRRILFFVGKNGMDIEHLGPKVLQKLMEQGFVKEIPDIYRLTEKEVSQLEGFKEKSVANLLESIEKSKETTLARFLSAIGIPYVGEGTADLIAEHFGSLEKIKKADYEQLIEIEGIGEKVAESVRDFFSNEKHLKEIEELLSYGVHPKSPKKQKIQEHPFAKKTFVLTGTLASYSRSEAAKLIKERGGKVSGSVSKNTDYVLVGDDPGSKYEKAKQLKIPILKENDFEKLL
ncbi:MAG: NAD-dependent DNA ligase LigA [Simkaniaceae bacterium]